MVAKSGVWAHLPARAYWALAAVWSARIVVQSAPLVAHGGYGPPGGVGTLSWVGVGHGVAFGRVFTPLTHLYTLTPTTAPNWLF